jgi:bacterioferritin-associated ferredoxin
MGQRTRLPEARKTGSEEPRIICYCNRITDQEITKTVKETGLTTVDEIKRRLRENLISNCAELNPNGQCCHKDFEKVIRKALSKPIWIQILSVP